MSVEQALVYGNDESGTFSREQKPFELDSIQEAKYRDKLAAEVDKVERTFFRKPQREYFECSARCSKATYTSSKDFDDCCEICFVKMMDKKRYVESEFKNYNIKFWRCIKTCNIASNDMLKTPEYLGAQAAFDRCSWKCMDDYAFFLVETVTRIAENLKTKFVVDEYRNVTDDEAE